MNRDQLNRLRRWAGVPQDFSAPTQQEINESLGVQTTGTGVTTSSPDNHTHPKTNDSELDYDADYDDDGHEEADVKFEKGDLVLCHDEKCVVVLASDDMDVVGVAPVDHKDDLDAVVLVKSSELEKLEEPAGDDEHMDDEHEDDVDVEMDIDVGSDEDDHVDVSESHGRGRDTKMTPSLSQKENKRNKKALNSKERQQGKKAAMGESMHYHSDDNYETHVDHPSQPVNVTAPYPTVFDEPEFEKDEEDYMMANDDEKVHVPTKVLSDLKSVITDCEKEATKAEKRDQDERKHYYADTARALQIVHDHLSMKTIEGMKLAQLYSQRMANVSRHLIPDHVWKFIVDGGVKRSLKDYMNDVKGMKYPIEGPRNTLDSE